MSTFQVYPHSEVIAGSFTCRFQDTHNYLYPSNEVKRANCKNWRVWGRKEIVDHLRLLYPQLSNVAHTTYLEMIRDIPFKYDLVNPALELEFQAVSKIVNHHDSLTSAQESEAVKILMGKINNPAVFNWQPVFNEMAMGCDVTAPVCTVDDFRFVLNSCFEDARRAKSRAVFYQYAVSGTFRTDFGEVKGPFKEKSQIKTDKNSVKASNASALAVDKCTF